MGIAATKPDRSAKVFGRGFLGVSSVVAFAIGATAMVFAFDPGAGPAGELLLAVVGILTLAFMTVEFAIAGLLYRRVHLNRGTGASRALWYTSFGVGGLMDMGTMAATVYAVVLIVG